MKINENIKVGKTERTLGSIAKFKIVDVTESQNGRYITSKTNFDTKDILFFIFQAVSAWSNHVMQIAIFDSTNKNICISGNWENQSVFFYNTIFEIVNNNQIRVKKYAQNSNVFNSNYTDATDTDYGAIRPNKIYAVTLS